MFWLFPVLYIFVHSAPWVPCTISELSESWSENMHVCVLNHFSHVRVFVTQWTGAHQAPLSMEFSRQEYWSGMPFLSPGSGRSPGGGNGNPFQCSCLENPKDRGAWQAEVHWVTKSQTWLKWFSTHTRTHIRNVLISFFYMLLSGFHSTNYWRYFISHCVYLPPLF